MKTIKPSQSGKDYTIWRLLLNYQAHVYNVEYDPDFDPGFRLTTINSCWISVESFLKASMLEAVYKISHIPKCYCKKVKCFERINLSFASKEKRELWKFNRDLEAKENVSKKIQRNSWNENLILSDELGWSIIKKIPSWEFVVNLYRLRNGIVHGQSIKIMKSHNPKIKDEISRHYMKSLNYLNTKKIINLQDLLEDQDIKHLLNRNLTEFIVNETANVIDDISKLYDNTLQSFMWKKMRNPTKKKLT